MHLADAFIQSDLHFIQVSTFYQLLLSLGIEPMILALLVPCSTSWATGKHEVWWVVPQASVMTEVSGFSLSHTHTHTLKLAAENIENSISVFMLLKYLMRSAQGPPITVFAHYYLKTQVTEFVYCTLQRCVWVKDKKKSFPVCLNLRVSGKMEDINSTQPMKHNSVH